MTEERQTDERQTPVNEIPRAGLKEEPIDRPNQVPDEARAPLFVEQDLAGYRTRWGAIQTGFVDEPRRAVEQADALVTELVTRLSQVFGDERRQLESQWEKNDKVSTEELRVAMRRYRSFFERLLTI